MRFYSTAELADILKMNIQVVTRKLQAGEIEGFKMGKDWRVEEESIQKWLKSISNQNVVTTRDKVLKNFMKDGYIRTLPAQLLKRRYIYEYFLEMLELGRKYSEVEINNLIRKHHEDYCRVRREMVELGMMTRKDGVYRRNSSYIFFSSPKDEQKSQGVEG